MMICGMPEPLTNYVDSYDQPDLKVSRRFEAWRDLLFSRS